MFQKMRQAVLDAALVPRAGANPNPERNRFEMVHAIGGDP
jgi:hypothetical protein